MVGIKTPTITSILSPFLTRKPKDQGHHSVNPTDGRTHAYVRLALWQKKGPSSLPFTLVLLGLWADQRMPTHSEKNHLFRESTDSHAGLTWRHTHRSTQTASLTRAWSGTARLVREPNRHRQQPSSTKAAVILGLWALCFLSQPSNLSVTAWRQTLAIDEGTAIDTFQ